MALAAACAAFVLPACGGGDPRQDADEPAGEYRLEIVDASFPSDQQIAERSTFKLRVKNADSKTAPNVAVTIETEPDDAGEAPVAFGQTQNDPDLADPARPIWIVDRGPTGGDTAYTNTWSLGRLEPGQEKTFEWRVTAVKAGSFKVGYELSPGLDGKAKLTGGAGSGAFDVTIDDTPPDARVDENGDVVRTKPSSDEEE